MPGVRPAGHPRPLMIFCTRICETDQIFAHAENKSADMESAMTFKQGVSGNPHGNRHRTRHLLNQEFMQALLLNFRHQGKKAIEKVARNQPAVYLKILPLLVPREMKVEHTGGVKAMSDEEIEQAIEAIQTMLAARAGEAAKVIEGTAEPAALPAPNGQSSEAARSRCTNASSHARWLIGAPPPRYPMVGSFPGCCARAASGHAAAPPNSVMN